jgi:hypothetical protein
MEKLDLYKLFASEYVAKGNPEFVEIGPARYFSIEGQGDPGGEEFTEKLGALYSMSFTVKMASKFAGQDYSVCKLEGLWWTDGSGEDYLEIPRDQWRWRLMIRIPDFITDEHRRNALQTLAKNGLVNEVAIFELTEGQCVQILHLGPYSREPISLAKMKEFVQKQQCNYTGLHHEIYLGDPRRGDPDKLKTILRQPVLLKP